MFKESERTKLSKLCDSMDSVLSLLECGGKLCVQAISCPPGGLNPSYSSLVEISPVDVRDFIDLLKEYRKTTLNGRLVKLIYVDE